MYNKIQMGIEGNKKQKEGTILMKEIRTEDAVGHILCHDITQIIKDVKKGVLFKKGHIVREEDIPLLLSVGKEHLYVWEKKEGILHENEGAEILYKICAGDSDTMHGSDIKEGKIELIADIDGVLKIRREALLALDHAKLSEIVRSANAIGAITCTKAGAIPALPHTEEIATFMQKMAVKN